MSRRILVKDKPDSLKVVEEKRDKIESEIKAVKNLVEISSKQVKNLREEIDKKKKELDEAQLQTEKS